MHSKKIYTSVATNIQSGVVMGGKNVLISLNEKDGHFYRNNAKTIRPETALIQTGGVYG